MKCTFDFLWFLKTVLPLFLRWTATILFLFISFLMVPVLLGWEGRAQAQDIHFSQYFSSPLILNPALTGEFDGNLRLVSNYKNQWGAVSHNPFETFAVSTDGAVYNDKLSAGLLFFTDKSGDSKMGINQVNFSLASKIALNEKNFLTTGIQSGWAQRTIDINGVTWDSQYDGKIFNNTLPSGEITTPSNYSYFDVSGGTYWKKVANEFLSFNAGVATFHLNIPRQGYFGDNDRLHTKWAVHGGSDITMNNRKTTFMPSFMLLQQGAASEFNIGTMMSYNPDADPKDTIVVPSSRLLFGTFYRWKDALILNVSYDYKDIFSVGFSYDINLSELRTASYARGGAEICLIYTFRKKNVNLQTEREGEGE